jgi:hypothetical protein
MTENETPPTEEPVEEKKPMGWLSWVLILVVILSLAGLTAPMVIRCPKKASQTEATSNLRQVGIALLEFDTDYGRFPDDETSKTVTENFPDHGLNLSGKSSNVLFRQLFAAGLTQSEAMFYAEVNGTRKPDGDISPGEVMKKGEVGFGYIAGLSSKGNPARPLAFCPIIPGTDRFDPKPFKGKAVILRIDNSVTSVNIDKDGHALVGGMNVFSPTNPIWSGEKIDIRYPE